MKTIQELSQPFKDEFGNSSHLCVVATIHYLPLGYPGAEQCRYVLYVESTGNTQFCRTYLDAMNECWKQFGADVQTVCWRPDELFVARQTAQ